MWWSPTNGGSDLIYIPDKERSSRTARIKALLEQDYVSGLFVDDEFGNFPGTLPMSQLSLKGKAVTPHPSIVVNFRSYSTGCDEPTKCSVRSPTPCCARARACMAASAAPTP